MPVSGERSDCAIVVHQKDTMLCRGHISKKQTYVFISYCCSTQAILLSRPLEQYAGGMARKKYGIRCILCGKSGDENVRR
jgi:hypothetical protein